VMHTNNLNLLHFSLPLLSGLPQTIARWRHHATTKVNPPFVFDLIGL
jgi:hypothetical protein